MQPSVHITNNGPHPAEKHAEITAWKILDLIRIGADPLAPDNPDKSIIEAGREAARQAKNVLKPQLEAALVPPHDNVVSGERGALSSDPARLSISPHETDHVDQGEVLAAVNALLAATPFAGHFARPEVQQALKTIVAEEVARVVVEERGWHVSATAKQ